MTAPRRLVVIGSSGAGKTTLARRLAARLELPHIELDALYWLEQWTPNPDFRDAVAAATAAPAWVVDGNYSRKVFDLTLGRAEVAVWLDYRLPRLLWQLTPRIWRRAVRGETLWNGNRERLRDHLLSRDSLYWWLLRTHRARRKRFARLQAEFPQLQVVRLRTPAATEAWLASLPAAARGR